MAEKTAERTEHNTTADTPMSGKIPFNKNIDILIDTPLPQYDRGDIKAFQARGIDKVPGNLIAFLCEKHLTPRWETAAIYTRVANPNVAHLIATGSLYLPSERKERFVVIYENNWGAPLFPANKKQAFGLKQDVIMNQFLPNIVSILKDFHEVGFVHGAIQADNIFGGGNDNLKSAVLGDGLIAPPSYFQSAAYESIERAMADPIARGIGHFVDDIYAVGVLLMVMLRTHDPLQGLSDREVIEQKIKKGSYAALTGKDRFTGAILELLRGMLHDDKSKRWSIEEVAQWVEGQRLSPKQNIKRKKAQRVFHFEGERYTRPELLAMDLPQHVYNIPQYIEDEKLELWIKRSLEDKETLELFEQAILTSKDAGLNDTYKDRLASRLSIALDPPAPIRYKGISFHPDGFATSLAKAFILNEDLNPYAEIIDQGLVMFWLNAQMDKTIDYGSVVTRFEQCRSILKNHAAGFGLERCVYFLNGSTPCLSPKLKRYYIKTLEEMVMAFEDLCKKGEISKLFLDRHSIAFLSVKDSRILDSYLIELNAQEEYKQILGNVWAIANIQRRYELPALPYIAEHVVKMLDPVLERFHDRKLREKMRTGFEKIKKSGDLYRVRTTLENPEIIEKDTKSFYRAMKQFQRIETEKQTLLKQLENKSSMGGAMGRTVAAVTSCLIGGIGIIALALIELSNTGAFG